MATYYVRSGGNNANAGTSYNLAWQTWQKALQTITAGDTLYVCGTLTPAGGTQVYPTNGGTSTAPIKIIGANSSTGVYDGSYGTIDAVNVNYGLHDNNSTSKKNIIVRNMEFKNSILYGVYVQATGQLGWQLYNCKVDNSTDTGFQILAQRYCNITNCISTNSQAYGFCCNYANGCTSYNAKNDGFLQAASAFGVVWDDCIAYSNLENGFHMLSNGDSTGHSLITNCVAYNNGLSGIITEYDDTSWEVTAERCLLFNNVEYGITCLEANPMMNLINNHFHNNGIQDYSSSVAEIDIGATYGDPLCVDPDNGDFRLLNGSPAMEMDGYYKGAVPAYVNLIGIEI